MTPRVSYDVSVSGRLFRGLCVGLSGFLLACPPCQYLGVQVDVPSVQVLGRWRFGDAVLFGHRAEGLSIGGRIAPSASFLVPCSLVYLSARRLCLRDATSDQEWECPCGEG